MSDSEFQVIHTDHLITVLRGDDVVGHVIPVFSGYATFAFNPENGCFDEFSPVDSYKKGVRLLQDAFALQERAA